MFMVREEAMIEMVILKKMMVVIVEKKEMVVEIIGLY